jgi:hypothetical protein
MMHSAGAMGSTTTPSPAALNDAAEVTTTSHARPAQRPPSTHLDGAGLGLDAGDHPLTR